MIKEVVEFTINMIGPVDADMLKKLVEDSQTQEFEECTQLNVNLHTEGGDDLAALAIYDFLRLASKQRYIVVNVFGACLSAGIAILCAADHRTATLNSYFLYHFGNCEQASVNELKHHFERGKRFDEILMYRSGMSKSTVRSFNNQERHLTALDAKRMNLIDEVVTL
jgi:ATP-dependent protease ClpP protease subunit